MMRQSKNTEFADVETSEKIIRCIYAVSNELGIGFVESVYGNALRIALEGEGLRVEQQVPLTVKFRGKLVGQFLIDLLVEDSVILELKAVKALAPEHQMQILNYLRASMKPLGLLVNFGTPKVELRRFDNRFTPHPLNPLNPSKNPNLYSQ
jgi:GxxExxY protein